jgi:hypothetical protein
VKSPAQKAIVTSGSGRFRRLLHYSRPTFERFAARHGYDVVVGSGGPAGRPPAWGKLTHVSDALQRYDVVLWIDADAMVVDDSEDPVDLFPARCAQALVRHRTPQGEVPNSGVWLLRAGPTISALLEQLWERTDLLDHPWWENAALCEALGYELTMRPATDAEREVSGAELGVSRCRLVTETSVLAATHWLGKEWNSIPSDPSPRPRIKHYAGRRFDTRLDAMARDRELLDGRSE